MNKTNHQFLRSLLRFGLTVSLAFVIVASVVPTHTEAESTRTIPFSARLRNPLTETVVSDGTYNITFRIYDSATGGSLIWSETQAIKVTTGVVVASLGSVTPFPSTLNFEGSTYYLEAQVNNDAPLLPRKRIESVASAFNANRLDGAAKGTGANNILQLDGNGDISINGGGNFEGQLTVTGAAIFNGQLNVTNGIVAGGSGINIGSASQRFGTAYVDVIDATTSSIGGTTNSEFTVNSDAGTGEIATFQFAKGSSAYAGLQWDGTTNQFNLLADVSGNSLANLKVSGFIVGTTNLISLPNATTTLVGTDTSDTLTNKTLSNATLSGVTTGSGALTGFSTYGNAQLNGGSLSSNGVNGITIDSVTSTITGAKWGATAITATKGGTGQTLYDPGDMLYAFNSTTLQKLSASGNVGKYLRISSSGYPEWATVETGGDITEVTTDASSGLSGGNTSGAIALSLNRSYANTWTALQTITNTGASLILDGNVSASSSVATFRLGNPIVNGNSTALTGGTYIGINAPAANAGSTADFLNFQSNNVPKLVVTSSGAATLAGSLTVQSGGISVTGDSTITGALNGLTNLSASGTVAFGGLSADGVVMTDGSSNLTTGTVSVAQGGTGATSLASGGLLYGNGNGPVNVLSITGSNGKCLTSDGSAPVWTTCTGGVNTIAGESGDVAVTYAETTVDGAITIQDASTAQKGVARFNSINFSVSSGLVNTVQGIAITSSPQFTALTLTSGATVAGNINANGGIDINDVLAVDVSGNLTTSGTATFDSTVAINGVPTIAQDITFSATTPSIAINNGATLSITDGTNNLLQLADNGTIGSLTVGSITATGLSSGAIYSNSGVLTSETYLSVARGGTGAGSFTSGGVLYGNGTSAVLATASGSPGDCLLFNGSAPEWGSCTGATGVGDITAVGNTASGRAFTSDNTSSTELYFHDTVGSDGYGLLTVADLGAPRTYTLPNASGEVCLNTGNCAGSGSASTLQAAYDAGNQIDLSSGRDLSVNLVDRTTDPNFAITVGSNSTSTVSITRAAGAGTSSPSQFLLLEDLDADLTVADGLTIRTAGVLTDAIDASDAEIVNALNVGANTIVGTTAVIDFTNFDLAADGTITNATWSGAAIAIANGGTGSTSASGARTNLGLGTIATQNAINVSITGGSINGTAIGGLTASTGAFTTLTASSTTTLSGNLNADGGFDVNDVITIDTAGDLTTSGSATFNGATSVASTFSLTSASPSIAIGNTKTLNITDGTNTLLSVADSGTTGTLTVNAATISGLSSGVVYNSSGALTSEAQLSATRGGTGLSSVASGALLYGSGTGTLNTLSITGSTNKCLISSGSAPQWQDCTSVSGVGDITAVNAGYGLSGGGTTGPVTLDINAANPFEWSEAHTFMKSGATALAVTGAPVNVTSSSLVQIGGAINNGNSDTDGGTYLGINAPATGPGSAADLLNFQVNGASMMKLTSIGDLTVFGKINTARISGGDITGGSFNSASIDGGSLSASAVNGLSVSGGIVSGSGEWQASAIAAGFGGTGLTLVNAGDILYGGASNNWQTLGKGISGECLVQGASSAPEWGSCAGSGAGGVTLQAAYDNGNSITTTNARNIAFNVANTSQDANILFSFDTLVTSDSSTGRFAIQNGSTDTFKVLKSGATTISSTLEVTGNTTLTGDLAVNGGDITSTATTFNLSVGNTGTFNVTDGTNNLLTVTDAGTTGALTVGGVKLGQAGSFNALSLTGTLGTGGSNYTLLKTTTDVILNAPSSTNISFNINDVSQATISSNGKFGIGTAGTNSARLHVIDGSGSQLRLGASSGVWTELSTNLSTGNLDVISYSAAGKNLNFATDAMGISFAGTGTHTIQATSGTLSLGATTLAGAISGANQNISSIGNITANSISNTISGFGTINGATLSGGTLSGGTYAGNSVTSAAASAYSVIAQGGNINLQASTGVVAINQSGTNNAIRVYGSGGSLYYGQLTNDNTNTVLSSSAGELQLSGGDSTNQFVLGDTSAAVNLVFEKSSTISSNTSGGIITVGDSDDVFNFNSAASYYFSTLKSSSGALTLSPGASSGTAVAVNPTTFTSGNLLDLQVNSVSKASISYTGVLTASGLTSSSLSSGTATALTVDSGTTGALNVGTGSSAKTITIGNTTGATALTLDSGTGAINIGTGAQARSVNVGTGAAAQTVTVGSTTTSSTTTIQAASSITINGAAATTYAIGAATTSGTITIGGTAQTGALTIGQSTDTNTLNLATGTTAAGKVQTVNIATSATSTGYAAVTIGNTNGASALTLQAGTGNISLTGAASTAITIGSTSQTGTITLGQSTASNTINIGNANSTGTQTINIGAGTPSGSGYAAITIGNTAASSTVNIKTGSSGGITLGDGGSTNYAKFDSSGALTFAGAARPTTELFLLPNDANPGTGAGYCASTSTAGSDGSDPVYYKTLNCDATNKDAFWTFKMPQNYVNGSNITVDLYWISSATSGAATFDVAYAAQAPDDTATNWNSKALSNTSGSSKSANSIAYTIQQQTVTLLSPGVSANNMVNLRIRNSANSLSTTANVLKVRVKFTTGS